MEDLKQIREDFMKWIRDNKAKEYYLKELIEKYTFWREKWMSGGGINYEIERVQGGTGIDPHMHTF